MSIRRCSILPWQRGSSTTPRCRTRLSMDMILSSQPRGHVIIHQARVSDRNFMRLPWAGDVRVSYNKNGGTPLAKCSGREGGKARGAGRGERAFGQPSCQAIKVEGRGGCHALQARLGQPAVARPAQAERTHALRERTLDTLALGVELAAGRAVQACSSGRDRLVFGAGAQPKPAADPLRAPRPRGARLALGQAEASPDEGSTRGFVPVLAPTGALMALGTAHATVLPLHHKVGGLKGTLDLLLPALVRAGRADQVDAVVLARPGEVFGADIS